MIRINKHEFYENEILSSINFIKNSDQVFVVTLEKGDLKSIQLDNFEVIEETEELVTLINKNLIICENQIIYCHADYVEGFFELFKDIEYKNLSLITSQSDRKITKSLFRKKPKCIRKWYSTNVNYINKNLIPIPLGIAPYRNTKSVVFSDFELLKEDNLKTKSIYLNFNTNTNYFHRLRAKQSAIKKTGVKFTENKNYLEYLTELMSYKFSICPWGNGYDTHRFWESLYSGTIPITKSHLIFESFRPLPMILVKNYKQLSEVNLDLNFNEYNLEKLKISWWINKIRNSNIPIKEDSIKFSVNDSQFNNIIRLNKKFKRKNYIIKKLNTFLRKAHYKINTFHKTLPLIG